MRIRSIKPEFWRSDDIAALPVSARLLFIGLWSYVDDNGVGSDKVSSIAADLFAPDLEVEPAETFRRVSVDSASLSEAGLIVRFRAGGKALLYITKWEQHQLVKNPSLGHKYPLPSADLIDKAAALPRPSGDSTETLGTGTGEQGNRGTVLTSTEGGQTDEPKSPYSTAFEAWWAIYPRKESKGDAWKAWEQLRKSRLLPALDALNTATLAYAAKVMEPQFRKLPAGWLRAHKWEDETPAATPPASLRDQYAGRDFA